MIRALSTAAACLLFVAAEAADRDRPEPQTVFQYLGVKWCRGCHSRRSPNPKLQIFHSWEGSAHARAWEDLPATDRDNPECLRCHTTGYGMPRRADTTDEDLRGVQCEACHGPGSHYFTWTVMADPDKARDRGLVMPDREVCTRCHW